MVKPDQTTDRLEVKEGIVLDSTEQVVLYDGEEPDTTYSNSSVRTFQIPWLLIPLVAMVILATFVFGAFILSAFFALTLFFIVVRTIINKSQEVFPK
jgi:hypothetical protein